MLRPDEINFDKGENYKISPGKKYKKSPGKYYKKSPVIVIEL